MPVFNGRAIRELWMIQFASKKNVGKGREIHFEEIIAGIKVWALDGDGAVREAQEFASKNQLPWLGLRGLTSLDLIETHIYNQPKSPDNQPMVQPASGKMPSLKDLPPLSDDEAINAVMQQEWAAGGEEPASGPVAVEELPHESPDRHDSEEAASTPASLIVKP